VAAVRLGRRAVEQSPDSFKILTEAAGRPLWIRPEAMHNHHPVFHSLASRLRALRDQYERSPNEHTRYQLVRYEQLVAQWAPETGLLRSVS
jgi:hypothetical protein